MAFQASKTIETATYVNLKMSLEDATMLLDGIHGNFRWSTTSQGSEFWSAMAERLSRAINQ